ncbi:MAG: hypothetical protein ABI045_07125 [Flavobacteriales bacterium]
MKIKNLYLFLSIFARAWTQYKKWALSECLSYAWQQNIDIL